ncbi:MAG: pyruvate dehydrogenase (acetyl-transferring) E1 component subunit alpha [Candidatus Abyssobacteria bacterium SURF_5]|uniref:Pyruvate dehydrogenase E1 component subunit alpha n=1 Tax=Abyssobacteria bacterium (strain SURF_5) TaxID=2093360 RepID=A0A3A4NWA4_ABYX5|nr:MAG: pyruvate dehydrogenase (acetyl-transferring) E1 component subunit alpha [Candidatus Abyssubacteria bacterium SURF_5]
MNDLFKEFDPLKDKMLRILDENGILNEQLAPALPDGKVPDFLRWMLLARAADQKALNLQRQGRMGTYASLLGQEAIQLGSAAAMGADDWFFPSYRELLVCIYRGLPLSNVYLYWMGNEIGSRIPEGVNMFPFSVPVGSQILHAVGAAWAAKLQKRKIVVAVYFGDGATSEGDFHEGLNFAGVLRAPVVFICQNNQYAISVPLRRQTAAATIAQKAVAYGFEGIRVDGNDVFACYAATKAAFDKARAGGGPTLIEAVTYRLGAHTTSDDPLRYRDDSEVEQWRASDPLTRLEKYLRARQLINDNFVAEAKAEADARVEQAVTEAEAVEPPAPPDLFQYMFKEMPASLKEQLASLTELFPLKENKRG